MAYCEDYPCCGHTPSDPCTYYGPTSEDYFAMFSSPNYDSYYDEP